MSLCLHMEFRARLSCPVEIGNFKKKKSLYGSPPLHLFVDLAKRQPDGADEEEWNRILTSILEKEAIRFCLTHM